MLKIVRIHNANSFIQMLNATVYVIKKLAILQFLMIIVLVTKNVIANVP